MSSTLMLCMALTSGTPATQPANQATAQTQNDEGLRLIHVADLAALQADSAHPVHVYDANGDDFRKKEGVIPGAVLLSSCSDYDVSAVLPQDKASNVVFYCGNTKCMASHAAAKRATKAGYANVSVMADGLMGWKEAGKPVSKL